MTSPTSTPAPSGTEPATAPTATTTVTTPPPSPSISPCPIAWLDVVSADIDTTTRFLTRLFGWSELKRVDVEGNDYLFLGDGALPVLGAEQIRADQGVARWTVFVTTPDASSLVLRAKAAGGDVGYPPTQLADLGIIAMVTDPFGATIGVWQPIDLVPGTLMSTTAPLVAARLTTPDLARSSRFFSEAFGWTLLDEEPGGALRMNTGGALAELFAGEQGEWIPVFHDAQQTHDTGGVLERAVALGGTITAAATSDTTGGEAAASLAAPNDAAPNESNDRLVRVADPAGAEFLLITESH